MNFLEFQNDKDVFAYFDVQNLSVDHPVSDQGEIEAYKDLIFSANSLHQVYFKETCDLDTINLIKDLLHISDYVDDFKVDKYILLNLSQDDIKKVLNATYENPQNWKLPYEIDDDNFVLTDIPRLRLLYSYVDKLKDSNLSPIEEIMKVYDEIKLYDYSEDEKNEQLPSILDKKCANSYGMNKIFSFILDKYGYHTYMGQTSSNGLIQYFTLVEVKDEKYNLDGIYLFDPSMDSLPKDIYPKQEIRRINYNFFAIPFSMISRLKYDNNIEGILSILSVPEDYYSYEKIDNCKDPKILKEKEKIEKAFNIDCKRLYSKLKNTKEIDVNIVAIINSKVYGSSLEKYGKILEENYNIRKEELFNKNVDEELKEIINN